MVNKSRFIFCSLQGIFKEMPHLMMDRENPESQSRACGMAMLFADLLCNIKVLTSCICHYFKEHFAEFVRKMTHNQAIYLVIFSIS